MRATRRSFSGSRPLASPYLPSAPFSPSLSSSFPPRQISLRRVLRISSKRLWLLLLSLLLGTFLLLHSTSTFQLLRPHSSKDPFASLAHQQYGGHVFYPARNASLPPFSDAPPPLQPHLIHLLVEDARFEWEQKLGRQSQTLEEAVREYERRYGRRPPRGFGAWYEFAVRNRVQMVDEYDSVWERVKLFASLPASVLRERSEMLQRDEGFWMWDKTFTIKVREQGKVLVKEGPMKDMGTRANMMLRLLEGIAEFLPDLNITMTGHDVPWVVISGEARDRHRAAADAGELIEEQFYADPGENGALDGWTLICSPRSAIRQAHSFELRKDHNPAPPTSFIRNHVAAMDVCAHPSRQALHGFTAWPGPRPGLLFPLFSLTSSCLHSDLLVPPLEQYENQVGPDPSWGEKKFNKLVWRGSTTGSDLAMEHMRRWSQRPRLCRLPRAAGPLELTIAAEDEGGKLGPTSLFTADAEELASEWFDIMFAGFPTQCGTEQMCDKFEKLYSWDTNMDVATQNEYKYVLDVDGNGWSGRFHRLMASNSLVLKSTIFPEWYSERIQPWVHYVPISTDYQDLWAVFAFFRGDLKGRGAHDEMAERIASEGKKWAEEFWRWEDMQAYLLRLLLEYARVMNRDPDNLHAMDYEGGG